MTTEESRKCEREIVVNFSEYCDVNDKIRAAIEFVDPTHVDEGPSQKHKRHESECQILNHLFERISNDWDQTDGSKEHHGCKIVEIPVSDVNTVGETRNPDVTRPNEVGTVIHPSELEKDLQSHDGSECDPDQRPGVRCRDKRKNQRRGNGPTDETRPAGLSVSVSISDKEKHDRESEQDAHDDSECLNVDGVIPHIETGHNLSIP